MTSTRTLLPGYEYLELLHSSSRTLVYRGLRLVDRNAVIIKLLNCKYPTFSKLINFRNQYTIAKNLDLPGLVKPLALEHYSNSLALVMEDFGGISLSEYIAQQALNIEAFLQIALALCQILEGLYRHRVIHKDIKPSNILIHPDSKQIKLIDFSISSLLPRETQVLQNPNILEGTLAYLSPEQTGRMNRGIDYRSDFYSLGVTFYQLLTGQLPFVCDDPMELVHCHIAKIPTAPHAVKNSIPPVLSDLVMKLMAKTAERRYQSALGLKSDLEKCLSLLHERGTVEAFELGRRDRSDRFLIPEKLYGRETEVQTLLQAFHRVANGTCELMLVAGFSGIGKTAVINEVHKPIVRQRGYFIKGKFDQFQRNIPFSAFVQAFRDLMGQLLGESDAQLERWKAKILQALGENGQVIIEVIPELERIIGKQPPATELSGSAAQNRFNRLFQKFIQVFTTANHPLVAFIDDLQWADSASLKLMQLLASDLETGYLLLLGAYRDNEVFPAHPLMLVVDEVVKSGATINTITLAPLSLGDLNRLVADTLSCQLELALPLTELIHQKTKGNPFFATQFLKGLHEDGWIAFALDVGYWQCDLARVRQLALTDDVVEFMATRLYKLPEKTQQMLKLAACIGNQFDLTTLAVVCEEAAVEVATALWAALKEGLVLPVSDSYKFFQEVSDREQQQSRNVSVSYKFLHDRVQQAAYSLIPDDRKQTTHYHIGQLLLQNTPPETREDRIFEIVNQLNYGTALIAEQKEREQLAQLNLIACRKAKSATAYQAGRDYANIGISLLGQNGWQRQYEMSLAFYELAAELASLCGDFEVMENFVETVIERANSLLEQVNVRQVQIQANASQNKLSAAVAIAEKFLQQLGVIFPETPTQKDIQQALAEIDNLMGDREIEDLVHLPMMMDREKIAIVQIANSIIPATFISGSPLFSFIVFLSVKLSIQYGNAPASAHNYACYGLISCNRLQDIDTGVKFGQLALQVVSKLDAKSIKAEVFNLVGMFILHRKYHIKETLPLLQEGYAAGLEVGNLEFSGYDAHQFCMNSFWCGRPLATLEQETRAYCNGLVQLNQLTTANWARIHWQSILNLLGMGEHPSILSGEALQEDEFLPQLISAHDVLALSYFYSDKLMLCYLFGDIEAAQKQAVEAGHYLAIAPGTVAESAFYFYDSLTALAALSSQVEVSSELWQRVETNQKKLQRQWADYAPMNHQHKVDLVAAEKCRILGQKAEAIELYDRAISGAKENGFIQEEALANELAAKFYLDWGFDSIAQPNGKEKVAAAYMQQAYYSYAHWGAKAKLEDLEKRYPQLLVLILEQQPLDSTSTATIGNLTAGTISKTTTGTGALLDLATLMKASRTLSEEIELESAIANLMQVAKENAGAETIALMLLKERVLMLTARVTVEEATKIDPFPVETSNAVPLSIVNKVKRSQQPLLLANASQEAAFAGDAYIQQYQPQSILCLPLIDRGQLIGILYLENNQVSGAFTSDRLDVLTLLCSQAAISLENARLYRDSQNYARRLEQTQMQLVQSEKMATMGQLTAGVAHEINNPVSFISGNLKYASSQTQDLISLLEIYQKCYPNPLPEVAEKIEAIEFDYLMEDLPQLINSMKEGTKRIAQISHSMRTFSRSDTVAKVPFNIHEGLESTLLILKHRLKANQKRPEIDVAKQYGNLPEIPCYPGQLNQVFMNLLANAIDALEEENAALTFAESKARQNQITIITEFGADNRQAIVRIGDNGNGISEEIQVRIFENLFTTKPVGKGTGIGLAISRDIIEQKHGGTLTCISEVGKGTEFAIALPISSEE